MPVAIPLTRGYFALVDEADAADVLRFRWRVGEAKGLLYAIRDFSNAEGGGTLRMHRQILRAPEGLVIDHFDNNGLNNQRCNIRVVTYSVNTVRAKRVPNKHGHPGIHYQKGRYFGRTRDPVTRLYVRTKGFRDVASAAAAMPALLLKVHGAFPFTNDTGSGVDEVALAIRASQLSWPCPMTSAPEVA